MSSTATRVSERHRNHRAMQRRVDVGELVSNEMYRERVLWLQANDPTFDLSTVCRRLAGLGQASFLKETGHGRGAETSHLQRLLGMRKQASSTKKHKKYCGTQTAWIERDLAEALYIALEMDPLVEAGDVMPPLGFRDHRSRTCAWADGCSNASGHGRFGGFCEEHAEVMAGIRDRHFNARGNCLSFGGTRDYHIWGTRYVLRDEELDLVEAML